LPFCSHRIKEPCAPHLDLTRRNGIARRNSPGKVAYFDPVPPRLARNAIIGSTFEVGRRFRCTMRVDCGQLAPGAVIRSILGEWHPRMPERLARLEGKISQSSKLSDPPASCLSKRPKIWRSREEREAPQPIEEERECRACS
jgi:hypothetical protein